MSKVVVTICLCFFSLAAFAADEVKKITVTVINCQMNKEVVEFALPKMGTCKESAMVKLQPGEKHQCEFTPQQTRPYALQAFSATGALTMLPIVYYNFCIGVAKAQYGYQYVPCDEDCLETATTYVNPYYGKIRK